MKLPQLSLRDLFWLVALVAMGSGWWVDRRSLQERADWSHEKSEALRKAGLDMHHENGEYQVIRRSAP
jgi:hypothetical protein